jgi:hypothetical protein
MMKRWMVASILLAAVLAMGVGCAGNAKKMNHVQIGMTESQVVDTIGPPDSTSATPDTVYLRYRLNSGWLFSDDYYVRLRGGIVDAYGRAGDFGLGY